MNVKITINYHKKELAEKLEKTLKPHENEAITSKIINYEICTQR